jgi:DNA-binding NarL/FixJ family response regulator
MLPQILTVLITDDDEGDRSQIRRALKSADPLWTLTETTSIGDALSACEVRAFDCALIDYRLSGQDRLAGISALHEHLPIWRSSW